MHRIVNIWVNKEQTEFTVWAEQEDTRYNRSHDDNMIEIYRATERVGEILGEVKVFEVERRPKGDQ